MWEERAREAAVLVYMGSVLIVPLFLLFLLVAFVLLRNVPEPFLASTLLSGVGAFVVSLVLLNVLADRFVDDLAAGLAGATVICVAFMLIVGRVVRFLGG